MNERQRVGPDIAAHVLPWQGTYFPIEAFERSDASARFKAEWYTRELMAMREPSMLEHLARGEVALRFLWLRTWRSTIAVRVVGAHSTTRLFVKRTSITGSIGLLARLFRGAISRSLRLDASVWIRLEDALERAEFDCMPAQSTTRGVDGEEWILEAVRNGRYRLVTRWSPTDPGPDVAFRSVCETLLGLSGKDLVDRMELM